MPGPEFVAQLAKLPLLWQPGSVWDYGYGLDLAGLVVEAIVQKRLGQYLDEQVFKPLGMVDTGFELPASRATRFAKALPHDPRHGTAPVGGREPQPGRCR